MSEPHAELDRLGAAAGFLHEAGAGRAQIVLVLGSGFAAVARELRDCEAIPFARVPHWPVPQVEGHGAQLLLGRIDRVPVACLTGRVHLYEGWQPVEVVRAVRSLALAGARRFLLTNAAGGIRADLRPGDLLRISDHLNLTGSSPLIGPHASELGPRFPDQSSVWSQGLGVLLHELDPQLHHGVYAGLLGPSYETPAEIRMLRLLGADAVGMSTVHEAIALNALGVELAGLSLITNPAAGIGTQPLSHDEVLAAGHQVEARLAGLLTAFCLRLARATG